MSLRQKYLKIVSALVPVGAAGVSLLLGSTAPGAAKEPRNGGEPSNATQARVAERLAAIRQAVSAVAEGEEAQAAPRDPQLAWGNWRNGWWRPWAGWGNGGPRWNNWHNWHNWRNFWGNG
ncbi:MAG TPA: hypothetical protein VGR91_04945 [Stellaceae bacterium]|nr:hypothetical protein [Stellaceae bacterium]